MGSDDVRIVLHTPGVVVAAVRDDVGIWNVHWAIGVGGWTCTCREASCCHISAVKTVSCAPDTQQASR